MSADPPASQLSRREAFATTRWSVVRRAGEESEGGDHALEELCRACWFPVYAFIRRAGRSVEEAQDLTQGFFAHVLERQLFSHADPARGRFRSFLLGALKNFLLHEARHDRALKRGGGAELLPIDAEEGERLYLDGLVSDDTPDRSYDRGWARALLDHAMSALRGEYERAGKERQFEALRPFLTTSETADTHAAIAAQLGMNANSVTVSIHRMRKRYAEILREEIAETVAAPSEVDAEIRHLLEIVGR